MEGTGQIQYTHIMGHVMKNLKEGVMPQSMLGCLVCLFCYVMASSSELVKALVERALVNETKTAKVVSRK